MTRPLSPADRLRSLAGARPVSGSMFGAFSPAPTVGRAPSQLEGSGRPRQEKLGFAPGGQTMSWNNGCRPGEVFSALLGKCVGSHVGHVVSGARTLGRPNTLGGAEPLGADCGSDGDCASDNCFLSICAPGGGTPSVSTIVCGANQHVDGVFCVCDAGFQSINGECVVPNALASSLCQTSGGTGDDSNCICSAGYAWNPSNGCTNSAGQNGGILGSVTCDVGSAPDANGQCNCLPGLVWESTNVNDVRCVLPSKTVTCGINSAYDGKNCVCAAGMGWKSSTGYDCYPCPNGIAPGGDGNTCNPPKSGQAPVTPPPQVAPPVPVTPPPATPKPISNAAPSSDSGNGGLIAVLAVGAAVVLGIAVTAKKKRGKKLDPAFAAHPHLLQEFIMPTADNQPAQDVAQSQGTNKGPGSLTTLINLAAEPAGLIGPGPRWVPGAHLSEQGTNGPVRDFAIICRPGYHVGTGRLPKIAAVFGTNSPEYRGALRLERP